MCIIIIYMLHLVTVTLTGGATKLLGFAIVAVPNGDDTSDPVGNFVIKSGGNAAFVKDLCGSGDNKVSQ